MQSSYESRLIKTDRAGGARESVVVSVSHTQRLRDSSSSGKHLNKAIEGALKSSTATNTSASIVAANALILAVPVAFNIVRCYFE